MKAKSFLRSFSNFVFTAAFFTLLLFGAGFVFSITTGSLLTIGIIVVSLAFAIIFQLRFRTQPPSEIDVKDLQLKVYDLKQSLHQQENENLKLKYEIQNDRTNLLSLEWLWETNISGIQYENKRVLDYYKSHDNKTIIPWNDRDKSEVTLWDKRFIGVLLTQYVVKAGVNIKNLLVADKGSLLLCSKPTVIATGVSEVKSSWEIKVELKQVAAFGKKWVMTKPNDANNSMDYEFWESELMKAMEDASNIKSVDKKVLRILEDEAIIRVKSLLSMMSGKAVKICSSDELDSSLTLEEYVKLLNKEQLMIK